MTHGSESIEEQRPLSKEEYELSKWLLLHSGKDTEGYLQQLENATVSGKCPCGCASVDFSVSGKKANYSAGLEVLSEYLWRDESGNLMGIFVFAHENRLSGLEVWSVDGEKTPSTLPASEDLVSFEEVRNA